MNSFAVLLKQLKKSYNGTCALDDVSLNISKGSCFGLVGPNGAGKTTLINSICGIIEVDSGKIIILDEEMNVDNINIKKKIGILPEELGLLDFLKCGEYLNFVAQIYNIDRLQIENRINSLLKVLGMFQEKEKLLHEFSAGMRKKVAFIAAVIHLPEIIILDEPFESVDPLSVAVMRKIITKLINKNSTVLITSHNLYLLENLCNEVAIINKGRVIYHSDTKDIRSKIKNDVTQETYNSLEEVFLDLTNNEDINVFEILNWL